MKKQKQINKIGSIELGICVLSALMFLMIDSDPIPTSILFVTSCLGSAYMCNKYINNMKGGTKKNGN